MRELSEFMGAQGCDETEVDATILKLAFRASGHSIFADSSTRSGTNQVQPDAEAVVEDARTPGDRAYWTTRLRGLPGRWLAHFCAGGAPLRFGRREASSRSPAA